MKVLLAGATGAVGRPLVPLLLAAGHEVTGITRSRDRARDLAAAGVRPVVADVLDAGAVRDVVAADPPDAVLHQLTDLGARDPAANARIRRAGTAALVDAALAAGVELMVAQSIVWVYEPGTVPATEADPLDLGAPPPRAVTIAGVAALEAAVARMPRGVVLRDGTLYGPGTWYQDDAALAAYAATMRAAAEPQTIAPLHVDDAAAAAVAALDWPPGPVNVVAGATLAGRPVDGSRARELGWAPHHAAPSWVM